jgi:hypothetical protein
MFSVPSQWILECQAPQEMLGFSVDLENRSHTGPPESRISRLFPGTSGRAESLDDARYRLSCHWLLEHFPSEALPEAFDLLKSVWEYYSTPFVSTPALPSIQTQPAQIGRNYVRPAFLVDEDQ